MTNREEDALPARARAWAARVGGGDVVAVQRLHGGEASTVHALDLATPGGSALRCVLRRFTRRDWNEPDLAAREAAALRAVAGVAIPTPELVAFDAQGRDVGVPAVLMTRLPGVPDVAPAAPADWVESLARLLPPLHEHAAARDALPRRYAPYTAVGEFRVPGWASRHGLWDSALRVLDGGLPPFDGVAIHRDYHPANVLFSGGAVSGLVDWTNACRGPRGVDVAHCRLNLAALLGPDTADAFRAAWCAIAGREHDPRWDLVALFDASWTGYAPWVALGARPSPLSAQRARIEEHLGRVLERC